MLLLLLVDNDDDGLISFDRRYKSCCTFRRSRQLAISLKTQEVGLRIAPTKSNESRAPNYGIYYVNHYHLQSLRFLDTVRPV